MAPPSASYSRQTVICATDMLKALGHSGFDRFLMGLDLPDQSVGRGSGLMARATSLAEYAIKNPEQLTPERHTAAYEIMRRATQLWRDGVVSNLTGGEREKFAAAMERDGQLLTPRVEPDSLVLGGQVLGDMTEASITMTGADLTKLRAAVMPSPLPSRSLPRRIFIVHGHDDAAREAVARFLEKIGFEVVILHEQVNKGRTIIEKFEASGDVGFVVVLLTADDEGGKIGGAIQKRARQNVLLEWGYFIGRLERSRVCALKKGDIELPSDIVGIIWEPFDEHGAWKRKLAKELEAADFVIDWQQVGRS